MVQDFYQLREQPFAAAPDAAFLFLSQTHREALDSLLYGLELDRGFLALIAKPGLGKTTLLFHLLDSLRDKVTAVFLFQKVSTSQELLRAILADLGMAQAQGTLVDLQSELKAVLAAQNRLGKRVLVVIDNAQHLETPVLECVRMLSNFETARKKLIQVVLCGQPQLADEIASPALVQLKQRISIVARLEPLSPGETARYVEHRLRAAGYTREQPLFTEEALALVAQYSEGVPRAINHLCFHALGLGCALGQATIAADTIRSAANRPDRERRQKQSALFVLPAATAGHGALPIGASNQAANPANRRGKSRLALAWLIVSVAAVMAAGRWAWNGRSSLLLEHRASASHTAPAASVWRAARPVTTGGALPPVNATREPRAVPSSFQTSPPDLRSMDLVGAVRALSGRTLDEICEENFGSCNARRLDEIHKLNPRLANKKPVAAGRGIRMAAGAVKAAGKLSGDMSGVPVISVP